MKQLKSIFVSALVGSVACAGCGKKKSHDTEGNGASAANKLTVSGTLTIQALRLAEAERGILAFNLTGGKLNGTPTEVAVDATGNFTVPLTRSDEAIDQLVAELQVPRDQRDWAKLLSLAAKVTDVSGATVDTLKGMSDDELNQQVGKLANLAKTQGQMTLLVAYEKSGDKVAEASSFKFIGLPTASGRSLSGMPNVSLVGDTQLGDISGSGSDITSQLPADKAFSLSAEAQDTFADAGSTLKIVKNRYMNDWDAEPFYVWYHHDTGHMTDAIDKFSDVAKSVYHGYGFYVKAPEGTNLTYDGICGATDMTFTPPAAVTVMQNTTPSSVSVYDNHSVNKGTQGSSRYCEGGGFYAREDVRNGQTSFMLNFGTGGSITTSPEGLWRLKYDGTEVARFDLQAGAPVKDDKPLVFLPSAKFVTSGGNVVSAEMELYRWNGTAFTKISDMAPVKALVGGFSCSVTRTSDNGESRTELSITDDGKIVGAFDGSQSDNGQAVNPAVAVSDAKALSCYYTIGTSNYRVEYRDGL